MPRFVILEHDYPHLHWDLMLEDGDVLRTWRLSAPPEPGVGVDAEPSFDHRLIYLDYEGPISDGRGNVKCHDKGTFEWIERTAEGFAIALQGSRMSGRLQLAKDKADQWIVLFWLD